MLSNNQEILLKETISSLMSEMISSDNAHLRHVRQSAFDLYLAETNEAVQVHVMITRDETDFLGFLETECMS